MFKGRAETLIAHLVGKASCPYITAEEAALVTEYKRQRDEKKHRRKQAKHGQWFEDPIDVEITKLGQGTTPADRERCLNGLAALAEASRRVEGKSHRPGQELAHSPEPAQQEGYPAVAYPPRIQVDDLTNGQTLDEDSHSSPLDAGTPDDCDSLFGDPLDGAMPADEEPAPTTASAVSEEATTPIAEATPAPDLSQTAATSQPPLQQNGVPGSSARKGPKKVRGAFDPDRRKEVHEVRKIGACLRCRMLRKTVSNSHGLSGRTS